MNLMLFENCCLEKSLSSDVRFFEEKVHSLSVAPEPVAIWNKELEGLESKLFKELKTSPVAAPEHISGFFYSKRTRIQDLGIFSGSLLLLDVESVAFRCRVCCFKR